MQSKCRIAPREERGTEARGRGPFGGVTETEKREREPWRRGSDGRGARAPKSAAAREKEGAMRANKPSERVFSLALTQRRRAMHLSWRTHCETGSVSLAHAHSRRGTRERARTTRTHTPGPGCERTLAQSAFERTCLCTDARCSCALAYAPVCVDVCAQACRHRPNEGTGGPVQLANGRH